MGVRQSGSENQLDTPQSCVTKGPVTLQSFAVPPWQVRTTISLSHLRCALSPCPCSFTQLTYWQLSHVKASVHSHVGGAGSWGSMPAQVDSRRLCWFLCGVSAPKRQAHITIADATANAWYFIVSRFFSSRGRAQVLPLWQHSNWRPVR